MKADVLKRVGAALVIALLLAGPAMAAQGQVDIDKAAQEGGNIYSFFIKVTVKWVFPILALLCALYGLGRAIKRGEWDFFVICIVAALVLALFPTMLGKVIGQDFYSVMR